jgi:NAD(P)-dependent dehydrogenase (short-subunit alcohol dehydrogenase family)
MSLNDKVAIVTGATGTLGRVVTKMLLGHDAHVISTYRSEDKRTELNNFLAEGGNMLTSVQADVTEESKSIVA